MCRRGNFSLPNIWQASRRLLDPAFCLESPETKRFCNIQQSQAKNIETSLVAQMIKASSYNAGDLGSIFGLRKSPGEGNGYPFQYSCLENPMERGAWQATVHGVAKSRTRLSDFSFRLFWQTIRFLTISACLQDLME